MSRSDTAPVTLITPNLKKDQGLPAGASLGRMAIYHLRRDRLTMLAISILVTLTILSLLAPVISQYVLQVDPNSTDGYNHLLTLGTPGLLLGTDNVGRDQLSRLLFAGQVSLGIAVVGGILSIGIGLFLGVITGYYGGLLDDFVTWLIATLNSIPGLFLLLIISSILRPGPTALVIVLALLGWTFTTRLVRGETLSLRERDFIVAAKAVGASDLYIMFMHIIPNAISITVVNLALTIGDLILLESALSFLGVGIQPPTPTWGNMLSGAQSFFKTGAHLVIFPGLLIVITVLCLYIIGDGLRDALDPTLKGTN
jgi:peptide/nickel transport system permease protein